MSSRIIIILYMMSESIPFIPGNAAPQAGLLSRYLPPIAQGIVTAWLSQNIAPGTWLLDPFGAAPGLPVEAARSGFRVLVAANNPVARFLIELAAHPLAENELQAALAELADARKGEESLEQHLRGLYETTCAQCERTIQAQAFLWERGASAPYARLYHCEQCGDTGEHPATPADVARAIGFAASGLHRARALERIAPTGDPDRTHAEEALSAYLPRAVYALTTLINRLDGLLAASSKDSGPASSRRRSLLALTLYTLDQVDILWPYPAGRARPRSLSVPTRFRENNAWLALEEAVGQLAGGASPVALTTWPDRPPAEGGIAIFEGRMKDLVEHYFSIERSIQFSAAIGALPRPNQAYWTLSALWAGWLWGREALGSFKRVLRRRRYDWGWHTSALQAALTSLVTLLPEDATLFGLIGEAEAGFLSAALIAASQAGLQLEGLALREENNQAQILWKRKTEAAIAGAQPNDRLLFERMREHSVEAGLNVLQERCEPIHYLSLHAAALSALVTTDDLPGSERTPPAETYTLVQETFEKAFTLSNGFLRYGGSDKSLEAGHWWLREPVQAGLTLADRTEMAVVRYLQAHPGCLRSDLDAAACQALPGLLTPGHELVNLCLESYSEEDPPDSGRWRLRAQDAPSTRRTDLSAMRQALTDLAARLGFTTQGEKPVLWLDEVGQVHLAFYVLASATFGELVFSNPFPPTRSLIVVPGARASLVIHKVRGDPRLKQAIEAGWRFLKFRHLRHLADSPTLTREHLDELLGLDPLTEESEQLRLL